MTLTAHLCETYGLDPMTDVLDHSEGHAMGIASNHADVGHWFPLKQGCFSNCKVEKQPSSFFKLLI